MRLHAIACIAVGHTRIASFKSVHTVCRASAPYVDRTLLNEDRTLLNEDRTLLNEDRTLLNDEGMHTRTRTLPAPYVERVCPTRIHAISHTHE